MFLASLFHFWLFSFSFSFLFHSIMLIIVYISARKLYVIFVYLARSSTLFYVYQGWKRIIVSYLQIFLIYWCMKEWNYIFFVQQFITSCDVTKDIQFCSVNDLCYSLCIVFHYEAILRALYFLSKSIHYANYILSTKVLPCRKITIILWHCYFLTVLCIASPLTSVIMDVFHWNKFCRF